MIEYDNEEGGGDGDEVAVAFAPPGFQAGQAPQQNEAQQEEEHRYWQLWKNGRDIAKTNAKCNLQPKFIFKFICWYSARWV